jgi:hypothetical protein
VRCFAAWAKDQLEQVVGQVRPAAGDLGLGHIVQVKASGAAKGLVPNQA